MSKKVALTLSELPQLKEGYARVVHLTKVPEERLQAIRENGINYEEQGMLSSTACWWGNEKEVKYFTDDPRFSGPGTKAIVMDVPFEEIKLHNDPTKSPGVVPPQYLVGVIDVSKGRKHEKIGELESNVGVVSVVGFLGSLFFIGSSATGNAIANLSNTTSNFIGAGLFLFGIVGALFYFKSKK